jgi:gas vesicle protein
MKAILQGTLIASLAASCLAIAGCDSKGTTEVKQEAKAIDASYKAQVDLVEATAKNGPDNAAAEEKADALRNQGDAIKDHLIKEAKQTQHDTKSH